MSIADGAGVVASAMQLEKKHCQPFTQDLFIFSLTLPHRANATLHETQSLHFHDWAAFLPVHIRTLYTRFLSEGECSDPGIHNPRSGNSAQCYRYVLVLRYIGFSGLLTYNTGLTFFWKSGAADK